MTEDRQGETPICVRCHVAGLVQGVFFRASTREQAQTLGLTGYARNLPDGRVEVLACGSAASIARLKDWLRVGPPGARVSGVACEAVPPEARSGFSTD
jgi:acylphosphatase